MTLVPTRFPVLPSHFSLLTSYFSLLTSYFPEQKLVHVREQEIFRLLIPQIQRVVIDELLLGLEPFGPADIADLLVDPEAELVLEWPERHLVPFLATAGALDRSHSGEIRREGREP
jgi:hypothetical protein